MTKKTEYVYICNSEDCQELHESETANCDSCNSDTRKVHRGDMDMDDCI